MRMSLWLLTSMARTPGPGAGGAGIACSPGANAGRAELLAPGTLGKAGWIHRELGLHQRARFPAQRGPEHQYRPPPEERILPTLPMRPVSSGFAATTPKEPGKPTRASEDQHAVP